jgi:hypothetical protein
MPLMAGGKLLTLPNEGTELKFLVPITVIA